MSEGVSGGPKMISGPAWNRFLTQSRVSSHRVQRCRSDPMAATAMHLSDGSSESSKQHKINTSIQADKERCRCRAICKLLWSRKL